MKKIVPEYLSSNSPMRRPPAKFLLLRILINYQQSYHFNKHIIVANKIRIPANEDEITLYCFVGEAICKIQHVEQALNCSITLRMNPDVTWEVANEIIGKHQGLTFGQANKLAIKENLYCLSLQEELNNFLKQRNWLVHKAIFESREDFYSNKKEELFEKIKSISDKAEFIQHEIEYDMISFCTSKGRDMSNITAALNLQKQGIRVQGANQ